MSVRGAMRVLPCGDAFRDARERKGLTQPQLSALTNSQVCVRTISELERTGNITLKTARALSPALGLNLDELDVA